MKLTGIFGRLALTNLILLVLISYFIIYVFHKTEQINTILHEVTSVHLPVMGDSEKLISAVQRMNEFRLKYQVTGDRDFFDRFAGFKSEADSVNGRLAEVVMGKSKSDIYDRVNELYTAFSEMSESQINGREHNYAETNRQLEDVSFKLDEHINLLKNTADSEWRSLLERSNRMVGKVVHKSVLFMVSCIVGAAAVAFFNTRTIARPLRKLGEKTNEVAAGIFPDRFSLEAPYEIERLASDFNIMIARLKESREQKEEFVSNVSHELKTPLSSIKEAAQMLKEGAFDNDPESSRRLLDIIDAESERLIASVNGIIEISRLDINDAPYEMKPCSVGRILRNIVTKTEPIASGKKIAVVCDIPDDLPDVSADREMISRAAENLIGNALKYTPEKGEINISVKKTGERLLLVSVKDNGRGIAEADLPHIFERYRRGRNQQGDVKGTGLGLAIAKKIISRHGGEIWANSRPGEGSEFLFTLPLSF
ncbi:HAMP domain-containing histidine kinase [Geovibrio thiophilus]|uniref:histidine kinase n=1 Tax=Geovibrio thiophilus TaxID=139438 RepID=A0A410JX40_9BACT|nr:HAMP domain-containing sensor histidine kinase [Geovibrio thiophilus]QAR32591.1 HAMP domain-containing histidine kinase [Geovibrio thiophilus]